MRPISLYDKPAHAPGEAPAALRVAYDVASYDAHTTGKFNPRLGIEYTVTVDETSTTYRPLNIQQEKAGTNPAVGAEVGIAYNMPNTAGDAWYSGKWVIGKWNHVELQFDFVNNTTEVYINNEKVGVQKAPQITFEQLDNITTWAIKRESTDDNWIYYDNITVDQLPAGKEIPSVVKANLTVVPEKTDMKAGTELTLTTNVSDSQSRAVSMVEYFANEVSIGSSSDSENNYQITWPLALGEQKIKAVVTNENGDTGFDAKTVTGWADVYSITPAAAEHGTYTVSETADIVAGSTITVTAAPETGYEVKRMYYGETEVSFTGNVGTFEMPAENIELVVEIGLINYSLGAAVHGGTITFTEGEKTTGTMGETVTFSLTPEENMELKAVKAYSGNTMLEVTETGGVYSFTMPAGNVQVSVLYTNPTAGETDYLNLDFEDAVLENNKVITTDWSDAQLYEVGLSSTGAQIKTDNTKWLFSDRKTKRVFTMALDEPVVNTANNKVYVDFRHRKINFDNNTDGDTEFHLKDADGNVILTLFGKNSGGFPQKPQLKIGETMYETDNAVYDGWEAVKANAAGQRWYCYRAIIDFTTNTIEFLVGSDFENMTAFSSENATYTFETGTNIKQFDNRKITGGGDTPGGYGIDDVRIYTKEN